MKLFFETEIALDKSSVQTLGLEDNSSTCSVCVCVSVYMSFDACENDLAISP